MKKAIWALVVIVILGLIAWGVSSEKNKDLSSKPPIKIGVVFALSGIASSWTEVGKQAADLAASEINEAGGVNGRRVELIYEDSNTNPSKSVSSFQKLTTIDKVDAVVGDVWAFLTNPLIPLSTQAKTVLISPTVMDASVEKPEEYFFTLGHQMTGIEGAVRTFFKQYPNAKTAAVLCWGIDAWGLKFTEEYEKIAKEFNIQIVAKTCTTDFNPDYRNEAAKVKAANPDLVLINGLGDRAINTLRTFGVMQPIISDSNVIDGFENRDTVSLSQLKDVYVVDWHADDEFVQRFKSKYGHFPILESQNSYEAVRSIARALENNPENLLAGLKQVKYKSVEGDIDFTSGTNLNPNKAEAGLYKVLGKGNYEVVE